MNILLDTHALIWFTEGSEQISSRALSEIADPKNKKFLSIISLWEIVIKSSSKKLEFNYSLAEVNYFLSLNNIKTLGINTDNLEVLTNLAFYHKDPFDRIMIAQAISENLTIVSADRHFSAYPVGVLW